MKVLVAEDNVDACELLAGLLSAWGYQVTSMPDGEKAWEELSRPDAPRLLVLDIMMPRKTGLELCTQLRQTDAENPHYCSPR